MNISIQPGQSYKVELVTGKESASTSIQVTVGGRTVAGLDPDAVDVVCLVEGVVPLAEKEYVTMGAPVGQPE